MALTLDTQSPGSIANDDADALVIAAKRALRDNGIDGLTLEDMQRATRLAKTDVEVGMSLVTLASAGKIPSQNALHHVKAFLGLEAQPTVMLLAAEAGLVDITGDLKHILIQSPQMALAMAYATDGEAALSFGYTNAARGFGANKLPLENAAAVLDAFKAADMTDTTSYRRLCGELVMHVMPVHASGVTPQMPADVLVGHPAALDATAAQLLRICYGARDLSNSKDYIAGAKHLIQAVSASKLDIKALRAADPTGAAATFDTALLRALEVTNGEWPQTGIQVAGVLLSRGAELSQSALESSRLKLPLQGTTEERLAEYAARPVRTQMLAALFPEKLLTTPEEWAAALTLSGNAPRKAESHVERFKLMLRVPESREALQKLFKDCPQLLTGPGIREPKLEAVYGLMMAAKEYKLDLGATPEAMKYSGWEFAFARRSELLVDGPAGAELTAPAPNANAATAQLIYEALRPGEGAEPLAFAASRGNWTVAHVPSAELLRTNKAGELPFQVQSADEPVLVAEWRKATVAALLETRQDLACVIKATSAEHGNFAQFFKGARDITAEVAAANNQRFMEKHGVAKVSTSVMGRHNAPQVEAKQALAVWLDKNLEKELAPLKRQVQKKEVGASMSLF